MTDNEIIKANDILDKMDFFNQRAGRELWNAKPYDIQNKDIDNRSKEIAFLKDFLNRQKAEIERLKGENKILSKNADTAFQDGLNEAQDLYAAQIQDKIKSAAIKEFAERLKENISDDCHIVSDEGEYVGYDCADVIHCINNLVKEMTEVEE